MNREKLRRCHICKNTFLTLSTVNKVKCDECKEDILLIKSIKSKMDKRIKKNRYELNFKLPCEK